MKLFDKIRLSKPRYNTFNLSHERKMAMNMGMLYPMLVQDVIPGDRFRVKSEIMMRLAPMLAPVMHRVNVYTHYFFVPNRLVWDEWEDFITGGKNGTAAPVSPYINVTPALVEDSYFEVGSLADFMGLPSISYTSPVNDPAQISALPFRAYQMVYNEYYRDQNLSDPVSFVTTSGAVGDPDAIKLLTLRKRAWEKDYFTSALPWAQRGPAVTMPIEGVVTSSDVEYKPISNVLDVNGDPIAVPGPLGHDSTELLANYGAGDIPAQLQNIDEISVPGVSTTINDLRRSFALQKFLEKMARGGARYVEQILTHFGVRSSDARLQRPEYLGGGRQPVVMSEVLSTFQADEGNPQGYMAGHGISVGNTNGFKRYFEEHGWVIGIVSVIPKTAYQQGIPRMFTRQDKYDYFWPDFAHIGEQEIKYRELFYNVEAAAGTQSGTFGYTPRYAEYKYANSTVHGSMRNNLAYWHMGRIFSAGTPPQLNESFVMSDPTSRIFAVENAPEQLYVQLYNNVRAKRLMPYFGTPAGL